MLLPRIGYSYGDDFFWFNLVSVFLMVFLAVLGYNDVRFLLTPNDPAETFLFVGVFVL